MNARTVDIRLDVQRSIEAIRRAAAADVFISYGEVARESGVLWSAAVRSAMPSHLESVCAAMLTEARALVSSIVVNQENLKNGELAPHPFAGFISCAERLGYHPGLDRMEFLREQQRLTFAWGRRTSVA